ncbi:DoxX family protein [Mucilaginibacter sp. HC2]|uniref:DoxX family protein n=1 Tax=Mucilaginibacter inviolabilis TaxID=2714892 RepID=UPI001407A756|nr:DoxX family protein [Mucilaginibacter inviolabilis]NHA05000.1 DoxX family protein [Mucilaginibacter inviolabilis]
MHLIKNISLIILVIGYALAGINHFINPTSYYRIIPHYLPYPVVINIIAGAAEILLALLLIPTQTRPMAAYTIILMLIAFLPVHISMISDAPLRLGKLTVTPLLAWIRLMLQPVLMAWAWWYTKS